MGLSQDCSSGTVFGRQVSGPTGSISGSELLAGAPTGEHGGHGLEKGLDVEPPRPVVDVLQVQLPPLLEIDPVPARHLPEAGEGPGGAPGAGRPRVVPLHLPWDKG